ncbi:M23 family metallopeptidase [Roseivirga sp.]|uniref:M23 family metallopeptidase n=1 Tax=Roseivirga sp. TaxID=1964215 RepID=UPI003B8C1A8E
MKSDKLLIFLFFILSNSVFAQYHGIDKDYFDFPIKPDQVNFLSGTMGELRSSHFHAGLDIKTSGKEGLKVYTSAAGYVSRIRIGTGGYGNCVYVQHPNGTTTVYAHLQNFNPAIAAYALKEQYKRKSFAVNLFPKRGALKLNQGEILGFSGNSGSSTGPHLHFEIRGANQEVLDPLRIGFSEITDNIAPAVQKVAIKAMNIDTRIDGQFGRFEYDLKRSGNNFIVNDTIDISGEIGLELYTFDQLNGAPNKNGVPLINLYVNNELYFDQDIDSINFSQQKNIKIHTNYQAQKESRRRFNKLYVDDGNSLKFYNQAVNDGIIKVSPGEIIAIKGELKDAYGNESTIQMTLRGKTKIEKIASKISTKRDTYIQDNTLMVFTERDSLLNNITLYNQMGSLPMEPTYFSEETNVYLVDLRKFLPQSVSFKNISTPLHFADRIPAANAHAFLSDTYSLSFSKTSLFDTVYIRARHFLDKDDTEIFEVDEDIYPLKGAINAEFQPLGEYEDLEKYHVYNISNPRRPSFVGGKYKDNRFEFSFGSFGTYTLIKDEEAPEIKRRSLKNGIISFTIKDSLSGINSFEAKINGKWILMKYEPKRSLIWSERLDKNKPLIGEFELRVSDNAGNESIFKQKIE